MPAHINWLYLFWLDGWSDYDSLSVGQSVNMSLDQAQHMSEKPIIQSCIFSDCRITQLTLIVQVTVLCVCLHQKANELGQVLPWHESDHSFCPDMLVLSLVAAGWPRSCKGSLDKHMIAFCSSFRGHWARRIHGMWWTHLLIKQLHKYCDATNTSHY